MSGDWGNSSAERGLRLCVFSAMVFERLSVCECVTWVARDRRDVGMTADGGWLDPFSRGVAGCLYWAVTMLWANDR